MQHTISCEDCLVSFVVSRRPGDAVVLDLDEERALRAFADQGLVPGLLHLGREQ